MNRSFENRNTRYPSTRWILALFLAVGAGWGTGAGAGSVTVTNAVLVEDTFVDSQSPATASYNSGSFRSRSSSAATRAAFIQYDLPKINPGETLSQCALMLSYLDASSMVSVTNEIGCVSTNPNLTVLSWNYVTNNSGLINGSNANYTVNWGSSVTIWSEPMAFPGKTASPAPTGYQWMVYRDLTPADGLAQYVNSKLSTAAQVRVTFCIGPKYTGLLYDWVSKNRISGGPPAFAVLELTLKKPYKGSLLIMR